MGALHGEQSRENQLWMVEHSSQQSEVCACPLRQHRETASLYSEYSSYLGQVRCFPLFILSSVFTFEPVFGAD